MNRHQENQAKYGAKKHCSQMNEVEKEFLLRKWRAVSKLDWKFTPYSFKRMQERGISVEQLLTIFDQGTELIEFHRKDGSSRVLMRSKTVVNDSNVCVVFAPEEGVMKTIYLNHKDNKHDRIRLEFYDAGLDVINMYKGVRV